MWQYFSFFRKPYEVRIIRIRITNKIYESTYASFHCLTSSLYTLHCEIISTRVRSSTRQLHKLVLPFEEIIALVTHVENKISIGTASSLCNCSAGIIWTGTRKYVQEKSSSSGGCASIQFHVEGLWKKLCLIHLQ